MPVLTASAPRLLPGSRASRLRATHSYGFVLALVVASLVFAAVAPDDAWAGSVLLLAQSATFLTALWTSGVLIARSHLAAGLTAAAAVFAVAQIAGGGARPVGVTALLTASLVVATIVVIGLGVMDQGEVNAQSVRGAICVYVLLGMFFVFVYGALAALDDGSFFAQGTDGSRAIRMYFSFVTLATVGYGDYTAAGDLGRTVSVIEALLGQLYLVTVVALLVSRIGLRHRTPASSVQDDEPIGSHG